MRGDIPGRVVVGVDDSLAGLRALRLAVMEARRRAATLYAVRAWHVDLSWTASANVWPVGSTMWQDELERDALDTIERAFGNAMGGLPKDVRVVAVAVLDTPGSALVGYANRDHDILFVGCGRPGGLLRRWHRCTAQFCVTRARCPVTVVPPDAFARAACREGLDRAIRRDLPIMTG
jgi:nucleotide-binding universal stress UspA family protein